ncbi:nuclear transport factor 2 family protein [Janthinobacterium fluminis]|uniref:Nuclear transport factor 2 family protein n=1 Tax=Janthinobacterium fluminis TaxID=2987524 RepID=A0ABT5K6M4_9BURK|nr:nuclear transport factor 2 family protein [Janthinobacterium fluminis]MDC8760657.1 nuclear transport factor 2 family protein [Janthinobacterium fluminis]
MHALKTLPGKASFFAACLAFSLIGATQPAAAAPGDDGDAVLALVRQHAQAQSGFDQAALRALTADNYIEVSPAGEVDTREKMLAFYAPEQKRPAPAVAVEEPLTRISGDTAIVIARLAYTMSAGGQTRSFAMRASYVAQKSAGTWKLVGAQYTGIRPPQAAG